MRRALALPIIALTLGGSARDFFDRPWTRHTIDASSRGADGVRFADCNGDGLPDIATGWEEGGVVRLYLNPGPSKVGERWPAVTVGRAGSVEDAVVVDLDGDGASDVVSCSEGDVRTVAVHWGPAERSRILDPAAWKTEPLSASRDRMMWMFALPFDVDRRGGVDLVAGGKLEGGALGWFEAPKEPRRLSDWRWHPWRPAGWIMSLVASDMDGDGDADLVFSDRKGERTGCFWLENPGGRAAATQSWKEHPIGALGREAMFLTLADLDQDGLQDVVAAVRPREIFFFRRMSRDGTRWESRAVSLPKESGDAKAVAVADVDLDGRPDVVFSCERARAPLHGLMWIDWRSGAAHPIASDGIKYDLVPMVDLDGDGDLDAVTTEEVAGLGVVWYENPAGRPKRGP